MDSLDTLLIINAVTGWTKTSLENAISDSEDYPRSLTEGDADWSSLLARLSSRKDRSRDKLLRFRDLFSPEKEKEDCARLGISILPFFHPSYPSLLQHIAHAPLVLYIKGDVPISSSPAISVVGSRRCSAKGKSFAFHISSDLARRGITIISGLAYGIDTEAHKGALSAGGCTFAVLGCGLRDIYPRDNEALAGDIVHKGALLSEFPLDAKPLQHHFPRRNRLISGLSRGVLVIEAAEKSGSLITARLAADQGKDVFAVPGSPYDKNSKGTNALIRDGAKLTTCAEDVLEEISGLPLDAATSQPSAALWENDAALSAEEKSLLSHIDIEPAPLEAVCARAETDQRKASHILLTLELKKYIKVYPGNRYGLNYQRTLM